MQTGLTGYAVAVCLKTSDIVWASGPHFPGLYNYLQIFCEALIHMLNDGERVKADKGRGRGAIGCLA